MRLMICTLDCMQPGQSSTFVRNGSMADPNQISSKVWDMARRLFGLDLMSGQLRTISTLHYSSDPYAVNTCPPGTVSMLHWSFALSATNTCQLGTISMLHW